MTRPLPPGSTIGILGGGQLGRMLAVAASRLGLKTHIFCPDENCPAAAVANRHTVADYTDLRAVRTFATSVDVVTYEWENIPSETAGAAEAEAPVRPGLKALETAQDRLFEKFFISEVAKVPVAPFAEVSNIGDANRAAQKLGLPMVLKTRRMGYDGLGQRIIRDMAEIKPAMKDLGNVPLIAEGFISFKREVSVVCARSLRGRTTAYPLIENDHRNHILHTSDAPAERDSGMAADLAIRILKALDYVGVLAVEFFELADGSLMVNEIAPRVHNSGHWTQNAGCTDQFELHIRAVAGWPLGNTRPVHRVQMLNLIGKDIHHWEQHAADPQTHIHLYGKNEVRPGRKMGHVNRVIESLG